MKYLNAVFVTIGIVVTVLSFQTTFWNGSSGPVEPIPITTLSPSGGQRSSLPASPERPVTRRTSSPRASGAQAASSTRQNPPPTASSPKRVSPASQQPAQESRTTVIRAGQPQQPLRGPSVERTTSNTARSTGLAPSRSRPRTISPGSPSRSFVAPGAPQAAEGAKRGRDSSPTPGPPVRGSYGR